jgi:hypothetical protein
MDRKLGGLILLLTGCASAAQHAPQPRTYAAGEAWKRCLYVAVTEYAQAAPTFEDAYMAADSKCARENSSFIYALQAEPGSSPAFVERVLVNFDRMLRIDLSRAYVEARRAP